MNSKCPSTLNNNDKNNHMEHETSVAGGAFRNVFRSFMRVFKLEKVVLGSIPRHVPAQKIAKSADALGQLYDISSELYTAHEEIKKPYHGSRNGFARMRKIVHLFVAAAPIIFKSAVMGGILFSSFEKLEGHMHDKCGGRNGDETDSKRVLLPTGIALLAGSASGCLHGLSYSTWETVGSQLLRSKGHSSNSNPRPRNHLLGTMVSHSLVHGVLFGTYEFTKRCCLSLVGLHADRDVSRVEGAACVLTGGLVAGVLCEMMSEVVLPLEENGVKIGMWKLKKRLQVAKKPRLLNHVYIRGIIPSVVSTVLGFVAYEYAKEVNLSFNDS